MKRYIIAKMEKDWVPPYSTRGDTIPVVIEGTHPEYVKGTRFDWGFLQAAIEDGYKITVWPYIINRSNCVHLDGFDRTGMILTNKGHEFRLYWCHICGQSRGVELPKWDKLSDHLDTDWSWDYIDREGY